MIHDEYRYELQACRLNLRPELILVRKSFLDLRFSNKKSFLGKTMIKSGNRNNPYIEKWGSLYNTWTPTFWYTGYFCYLTLFFIKMSVFQNNHEIYDQNGHSKISVILVVQRLGLVHHQNNRCMTKMIGIFEWSFWS